MTVTATPDLLDQLADIAPGSALAAARLTRDAATRHTQGSYDVLFSETDGVDFTLAERFQLAQQVAHWHGDSQLSAHYRAKRQALGEQPVQPRFAAALSHGELLSFKPANATAEHLAQLQQAGWSLDAIVTLSQLVAFVSFQTRLLRSYLLLGGKATANDSQQPVLAGAWRTDATTHSGRSAPPQFTRDELGWEPWIPAKPLAEFNEQQQATLAHFGHSDSDYFRLLGRNLPLLEQRTLTDKGIFYTAGGLSRKERELAATVASKVNGCIYCASVHARKAAQLSKQVEEVQRLIDTAPGGDLTQGQDARWQAQIAFSASLSATPPTATAHQVAELRKQGLNDLELLDLAQSTAFFAWANRLMLTLGEPFND